MTPDPTTSSTDAPLTAFSQCHVGIVDHLSALARLPALVAAGSREARQAASEALELFRDSIRTHHRQEEKLLFTAMVENAAKGEELGLVQGHVDRLTREHREVESLFDRLEPSLEAIARGRTADLDAASIAWLVARYQAHATFEEEVVLPLAQDILGRTSGELASLAMSLHLKDPKVYTQMFFSRMT